MRISYRFKTYFAHEESLSTDHRFAISRLVLFLPEDLVLHRTENEDTEDSTSVSDCYRRAVRGGPRNDGPLGKRDSGPSWRPVRITKGTITT